MKRVNPSRFGLRRVLYLIFSLCLSAPLFGFDTVVVLGRGETENDAIKDALAEAVRQVNGTTVETDTRVRLEIEEVIRGIETRLTFSTEDFQYIRTASKGYVRSYEVLESDTEKDPIQVKVRATVLKFDPNNPRPGSAKSIMVGDFGLAKGALQFDKPVQGEDALLEALRNDLESTLVQSNKFLVVTRKDLGPIKQELEFIASKWVGSEEKVKLGNQYGADLLVSGRLERLYVHTDNRPPNRAGYVVTTKLAEVQLSMTVYNVGSGQIEWTKKYTQSFNWDAEALGNDPELKEDRNVAKAMMAEAAKSLTRELIGRTFRPTVVKVKSDVPGGPIFVLNTGSAVNAPGDVFELVIVGEEMTDRDTGLSLGRDETFIALIEIVRQSELISEAKFVVPTQELREWAASKSLDPTTLACRSRLE